MRTCLRQDAGIFGKEEFEDNLFVYKSMKDSTGFVFAERSLITERVFVYYEVDEEFMRKHPQNSLPVDQVYVEFGL